MWARLARILVLFLFVILLQFFMCGTLIFFITSDTEIHIVPVKKTHCHYTFTWFICPLVTGIVFRQAHCAESTLVSRSLCM